MNRLIEIGFDRAGHWALSGDRLTFELTRLATEDNILYAFICDGEVKYIGKTRTALGVRMAGYKNPNSSQTTNVRNHARIRELLGRGVAVEIYALPDNGLLHYGRFHLNLAAGLEDDLIRVIDPEWNGGRKESRSEALDEIADVTSADQPVKQSFTFVLHPTYFRTGFFNVGVASQGQLGADGETIELHVSGGGRPILGKINRTANINGTPRIMGGTELRDWFQNNCRVMDTIGIDVLSPTAIKLNGPVAS